MSKQEPSFYVIKGEATEPDTGHGCPGYWVESGDVGVRDGWTPSLKGATPYETWNKALEHLVDASDMLDHARVVPVRRKAKAVRPVPVVEWQRGQAFINGMIVFEDGEDAPFVRHIAKVIAEALGVEARERS